MIQKIFKILAVAFLVSGCSSATNVIYNEPFEWVSFEDVDLGISFEYPDYYGEPEVSYLDGGGGDTFRIRFLFDYAQDDPYLVYINGTSLEFENENELIRRSYKGEYSFDELCDDNVEYIPFVEYKGSNCEKINNGSLQNMAIVDAGGSSVEQVFLTSRDDYYSGIQSGFRIPFDYVEYSRLFKGDLRGQSAVSDLIERLDSGDLPQNLIDELDRFRVLLDSIKFI